MAKIYIKLNEEDKYDFFLFGIACQLREHIICNALNTSLQIKMSRRDDFDIFNNKRMEEQGFPFFQFDSKEEDQFCLVSNRSPKGLLIPEQKQIDYFFMVRPGRKQLDDSEILAAIKEISIVLGAYKLDVLKLKSKENLVF